MDTLYVMLASIIASLLTMFAIMVCPCSRRRKTIVLIVTLFIVLAPLVFVGHATYSVPIQYNGVYIGVKNIACTRMLDTTIYCAVQGTGDPVYVNPWLLFIYLYSIIYVVSATTILFAYMLNEIINRGRRRT